jgi:cyclomaltodextrinase / maltogenic alpha-amylase / neopullulanase
MQRISLIGIIILLLSPFSVSWAQAPEWSKGLVWYQIFPERFRNGDLTNEPNKERAKGPEGWSLSSWTSDWYARAHWEQQETPNFYDIVRERRYGGDLQGVIDQLDYLQGLGIGGIYFNPVFDAQSMHKYDATYYHHIDRNFGPNPTADITQFASENPADPSTWAWSSADSLFLQLIQQAHQRGIKVIIDGVFNHTGTEFWAFQHLLEHQEDSPYKHWYSVLSFDDPSTSENEFDYEGWWGFKGLPVFKETGGNLSSGAKKHIFEITKRWMDPNGDGDPSDGVDGWRLDVASEVGKPFWKEWHALVRSINPEAFTVAEIWDEKGLEYVGDTLFSSVMNYPFAYASKGFFIDETIDAYELTNRLADLQRSYGPGYEHSLQNLFDSHDTPRVATQIRNPGSPYNPDAYPKQGYKVGAPTNKELQKLSLMAVFQLSWPGAPMIYYGTETGMWGADDPDDRKPMIWSDMQYEAEKNHPYGWERGVDSVGFNADLFEHYSGLVQLRMSSEALRKGELSVLETDKSKVLAYERIAEKDSVLVIINHQDNVFWMESKLLNQVSAKYFSELTSLGQKTDRRVTHHEKNYEVRSNGLVIQENKQGILPYSYVIYRALR